MSDEVEEWRSVTGWPEYEVSNNGLVRSLDRYTNSRWGPGTKRLMKGRLLALCTDRYGYKLVCLCRNNKRENGIVHLMVLEAFVGPRPDGLQARHLDGDKNNNRPRNLAWGTPKENGEDKVLHGAAATGERNGNVCLRESQVVEIIGRLRLKDRPFREIAEEYGVSLTTIAAISVGKTWRHISRERMSRQASC